MSPNFDGPVYVLTSNESASAAEFAVDAIANEESVTIIGETTAGEMLSQKMYDLPFSFQLSVPIAEYYSNRIGRIEGHGVEPDIAIDQGVALDLAFSLINGKELEDVLPKLQMKIDRQMEEPFGGEKIYLFGNMNDWGKKWNSTPVFDFKGKGIFEASADFNPGIYEFKIAPMNWAFDYGAASNKENVNIGAKMPLARVPGSKNLQIEIKDEVRLKFTLDVSDEMAGSLYISKE